MVPLETPITRRARWAKQTPARAATPASSVKHPLLQIPVAPALRSHGVWGAPYGGVSRGQGGRFPRWGLGAAGWKGRPRGLAIASQGEDGLGADGTCSARERAFLLFMLSGGNA